MLLQLPLHIPLLLALATAATVLFFHRAAGGNRAFLWLASAWLALQAAVALTGFYVADFSLPPRFLLLVGPPLVAVVALFFSKKGRFFLDNLDLRLLTWLHVVRVPVELVLLWLFQQGKIPQEMTFEGRNFDVLSGLTAPLVAWLAFPKNGAPKRGLLLAWNFVCLALLVNIVGTAIVASPYFSENFGFSPPNVGVFYCPFVWLPCCIVPLVLLAHLAALRRLFK